MDLHNSGHSKILFKLRAFLNSIETQSILKFYSQIFINRLTEYEMCSITLTYVTNLQLTRI